MQKVADAVSQHIERALDYAIGGPEQLRKHWLRMARSFTMDIELAAASRLLIDESRRLLAALEGDGVLSNGGLLANSRALIDESRRLLMALERQASAATAEASAIPAAPIGRAAPEARAEASCDRAMLSLNVHPEGPRYGWTVLNRTGELLGSGSAETEQKARTDAFLAGMTYIERLKRRSRPTAENIH
jgi:hypothetical protein